MVKVSRYRQQHYGIDRVGDHAVENANLADRIYRRRIQGSRRSRFRRTDGSDRVDDIKKLEDGSAFEGLAERYDRVFGAGVLTCCVACQSRRFRLTYCIPDSIAVAIQRPFPTHYGFVLS